MNIMSWYLIIGNNYSDFSFDDKDIEETFFNVFQMLARKFLTIFAENAVNRLFFILLIWNFLYIQKNDQTKKYILWQDAK